MNNATPDLTVEAAQELLARTFRYEPVDGDVYWLTKPDAGDENEPVGFGFLGDEEEQEEDTVALDLPRGGRNVFTGSEARKLFRAGLVVGFDD